MFKIEWLLILLNRLKLLSLLWLLSCNTHSNQHNPLDLLSGQTQKVWKIRITPENPIKSCMLDDRLIFRRDGVFEMKNGIPCESSEPIFLGGVWKNDTAKKQLQFLFSISKDEPVLDTITCQIKELSVDRLTYEVDGGKLFCFEVDK